MKAAKTPKKLKEMPYPPQKKLLKRKGNSTTQATTNAPISQTSSEGLKLIIQMKLGQLQDEISKHLCQLVLIYVTTLNQLFWKLSKEKFNLDEVNFGEAAKIPTVFYQ